MTTRKQLEAEAEELFPTDDTTYISIHMDDLNSDLQRAFIKGRTVTTEQVEAAMDGYREGWDAEYNGRRLHQSAIEAAFRAAGFYIEEDNDE